MAPTTRMSGVDTAWYRMEAAGNPMMVTGLVRFTDRVDLGRLRRLVETGLVGRYPRFRQRVVGPVLPLGRPRWSDDPAFDLDRHLTERTLGSGDLGGLLDQLASTPLDRSRPLWSLTLVRGGADGDALIARFSHCIADGVALARMVLSLADGEPELAASVQRRPRPRGVTAARLVGQGLLTLPRLVALPRAPRTVLRGRLSGAKRLAWSPPVPLDEIKALGRATGATVNDVLLNTAAGALRRVLGEGVGDLRAAIPVDLRDPAAPVGLGNRFGLVVLALPVGVADAARRLALLKRRMDALKSSPEALVTFTTLGVLGVLPAVVERLVLRLLGSKATLVLTNVPGPSAPLAFAGSDVRELQYWVPQTDGVGVGVSILSYAGQVTLGVAADAVALPDPGRLVEAFRRELDAQLPRATARP